MKALVSYKGEMQMNPIEMTQHQIWFDKPAKKIEEAIPIGNGEIGGMVFGDGRILLNDGYGTTLGHLEFTINQKRQTTKKRLLQLRESISVEDYEGVQVKSFMSHPDRALILHFTYDPKHKYDIQVRLVTEPRLTLYMETDKKRGSLELYITYHLSQLDQQAPKMTTFKIGKNLKEQMKKVRKFSYLQLLERHIKDVSLLYQACVLKLPGNHHSFLPTDRRCLAFRDEKTDASLIALYFNFGRYLVIQSTRNKERPIRHENRAMMLGPSDMTGLSSCQDVYFKQEQYGSDHLSFILHVKERYAYTHDDNFLKVNYIKIKRAIIGILDKVIKEIHEQELMETVTVFYEEILHILGLANGEDYRLLTELKQMVETLNFSRDDNNDVLDEGASLTSECCARTVSQLLQLNEIALAKQYLYLLIGDFTCPNLMNTKRRMTESQVETQVLSNFVGTRAIAQMLVHSHDHHIHLLPGILEVVASGKIHGIRACGGHQIQLSWQNGLLESGQLIAGSTTHLVIQFKDQVRNLQVLQGETYELESLFIDDSMYLKMNSMR